ncbi:hypothetical protein NE237_009008 [Protea cynaroides]|uniref:Uncharacterized protein n=1 Tax=Protea cynaroides TaxID=273540 RepID=A0A9Q0KWR4_9MAGN|nr:hypothetical protein NE237_009008 [Protea cynaroides]
MDTFVFVLQTVQHFSSSQTACRTPTQREEDSDRVFCRVEGSSKPQEQEERNIVSKRVNGLKLRCVRFRWRKIKVACFDVRTVLHRAFLRNLRSIAINHRCSYPENLVGKEEVDKHQENACKKLIAKEVESKGLRRQQ